MNPNTPRTAQKKFSQLNRPCLIFRPRVLRTTPILGQPVAADLPQPPCKNERMHGPARVATSMQASRAYQVLSDWVGVFIITTFDPDLCAICDSALYHLISALILMRPDQRRALLQLHWLQSGESATE